MRAMLLWTTGFLTLAGATDAAAAPERGVSRTESAESRRRSTPGRAEFVLPEAVRINDPQSGISGRAPAAGTGFTSIGADGYEAATVGVEHHHGGGYHSAEHAWDGDGCCERSDCYESTCRRRHPCCLHTTCDMIPHVWYLPENHGYYYFRPYQYTHVERQLEASEQFGADPRSPYVDNIFDEVYEQVSNARLELSFSTK